MIGKLSWLARPTPLIAPFVAGAYAHTLWGPYFSSHAPISLLRSFALLAGLGTRRLGADERGTQGLAVYLESSLLRGCGTATKGGDSPRACMDRGLACACGNVMRVSSSNKLRSCLALSGG